MFYKKEEKIHLSLFFSVVLSYSVLYDLSDV
jgi:hypothetical protein